MTSFRTWSVGVVGVLLTAVVLLDAAPAQAATLPPVAPPPVVTLQPQSQQIAFGASTTFTAAASGAVTEVWGLSIDHGKTWLPLSGGTDSMSGGILTSTYSSGAFTRLENGWEIRDAFINDPTGVPSGIQSTATDAAVVTAIGSPVITTNPQNQAVESGHVVTFSAAANGSPTPSVQWQLSVDRGTTWFNLRGLTSPQFTSGPVTSFESTWQVRAVFTNINGTAISAPAGVLVL